MTTAIAQEAPQTVDNRDVAGWMKSAKFIVGCYNVEDMIRIPGTRWIIGSGVTVMGPGMEDKDVKGYLHVFDADAETVHYVDPADIFILPDTVTYPDTTTPPDFQRFSPHGIGLGERKGDVITLYVVNHGAREAVEVFKIDAFSDKARAAWVGTVLAPADGFIDAVAWVPGTDGFVATSLLDPRDPEGSAKKELTGEPNGWVREWHPKSGWKTLPGTEKFSTPNGVIVSPDGRYVFVAASANFCVYRIARGSANPEVVASPRLEGFPDNVRWSADGKSILAGVHTADPAKFAEATAAAVKISGSMFTTFNVTRLDPVSMKTEVVMPSGLYGAFGAGTTAIEVGNRLWLGSCKSDRVAIFDLHPSTPAIQ